MSDNAPLISWRGERAKAPLVLRVFWRYFISGKQLRGPGDNATFLHRATMDYRARPYTRYSAPVWQRLARRHAATTGTILVLCMLGWRVALGWMACLVLAGAAWCVWRAVRGVRSYRVRKNWVTPATKAACSALGIRWTRRSARQMLDLPADWPGEGRAVARLHIPAGTALTKALRDKIVSNVGARLGIAEPIRADWAEAGADVCVDLSTTPLPPREVTWKSIERAVMEAEPDTVVVGRLASGHLASVSLSEDAPHFAMSGASGTGKSVLMRVMLAPRVAKGDGLLITDPKKFSHWRWAGDGKVDPNRIRYAWRVEDLHEAWCAVGEEIARRIELDEDELAGQRRVFLAIEEINTQTKKLQRYWRGKRKEMIVAAKLALTDDPAADIDLGDLDPPVQSPAIVAMQEAVSMGRELRVHVVVAAQRLSASVFGANGGDIRESFQGGRFIAKWDRKLWRMLVDTVSYVACPSGPRGLWGVAKTDGFEILRVPNLSEADALAMVNGGVPVSGPVLGPQSGRAQVDADTRPAITSAVTLADALGQLPGPALTMGALRKAASRAGFPAPLDREYGRTEARLYDLAELIEWREMMLVS